MPNFHPVLRSILLLFLVLIATGCVTHKVGFTTNAPYTPLFSRSGWVAIVYPDDLAEEMYIIRAPAPIISKRYKTYWGGAVTAQASARFTRIFEGGALLISMDDAKEIERLVTAARAEVESPTAFPHQWRAAVRKAAGMTDPEEIPTTLVRHAEDPPAYIIRIYNPVLEVKDMRPSYTMDTRVVEPLSTAMILDTQIAVSGRAIRPKDDTNMMTAELREAISETINGAMIQLARALDAETGR